jgi:outer membrane biosynthesis protein TonB
MTNERKNKVRGILGTILFHLGLMLLLLFLALRTPLPLPGEEGVLVNLGYDDNGIGVDQQEEQASDDNNPRTATARVEPAKDEYLTQDVEEAPVIKPKNPEKKVEKKKEPEKVLKKPEPKPEPKTEPVKELAAPEPKPEPKPQPNLKAMYKGSGVTGAQGGQEGQTGQPGDQGQPNGTPGAPVYKGGGGEGAGTGIGKGTGNGPGDGSGSGISYSLGGRGSLMLHKPAYDSKEQGKVVVTIKVDKNGNVTSAVAGAKGTNVSDQTLWQLAKDAALKSKFASDPAAPDTQIGTITYNFIRQN